MIKKRHTKQKDIVINYLKNNTDKHLTAETILLDLKRENENVSQATVYRILSNLSKDGIVRKYISADNKCSCYQYVDNVHKCNMHYHLICDKCGEITHFENEEMEKMKKDILKNEQFDLNLQKVVLYGKCKKCTRNEENNEENN